MRLFSRGGWPLVILFVSGIFATACAPAFRVRVSSLSDATAAAKRTYTLYPGVAGIDPSDLQFKEFAVYVERALKARGFVPATGPTTADLVVLLSYGIGDPTTSTMHIPIYGQTGGGTATFSGTSFGAGGMTNTTGTVTTPATYGVVNQVNVPVTQYGRWAELVAVDAREYMRTQKIEQVWKTTVTSRGSSSDLRRVFPVMVAGAEPYLGAATKGQVEITVSEGSERVQAILGPK